MSSSLWQHKLKARKHPSGQRTKMGTESPNPGGRLGSIMRLAAPHTDVVSFWLPPCGTQWGDSDLLACHQAPVPQTPRPKSESPKAIKIYWRPGWMQFRRLTAVWNPSFLIFSGQEMGLLASPQHSLVLGQQHEHQPAWPWALFWCPAPLTPDCLLSSAVPHRWRPQPVVACGEDLQLTCLPFPVGAVDFSQKSSAWKSHPRCESARTVTIAYSTREGRKTGLETAETEGAEERPRPGSPLGPVSAPSALKQPPRAQLLTLRISGSWFRGRWRAGTSGEQHEKIARWFQACFRTRLP